MLPETRTRWDNDLSNGEVQYLINKGYTIGELSVMYEIPRNWIKDAVAHGDIRFKQKTGHKAPVKPVTATWSDTKIKALTQAWTSPQKKEDKAMEQVEMQLDDPKDSKLKRKWKQFHDENPNVWKLFVKFTFDAINAGYKNYSTNSVIERIRWHTDVETRGDKFKINNNHAPYYARYFHEQFPKHDGFFRTRETK